VNTFGPFLCRTSGNPAAWHVTSPMLNCRITGIGFFDFVGTSVTGSFTSGLRLISNSSGIHDLLFLVKMDKTTVYVPLSKNSRA